MDAPTVPSPPRGSAAPHDPYSEFVRRARTHGEVYDGYHNRNFVLPLTEPMARFVGRPSGTPAIVRMPTRTALRVVVRTWNEAEVLAAIRGRVPRAPECFARRSGSAVHSYVEGRPLSSLCENGKPVAPLLVESLMDIVGRAAQVRRDDLPAFPGRGTGSDKDSRGFLRGLAHQADRQIRQPNWPEFGGLFAALGVSADAFTMLAERVPTTMSRRPYGLLHTDLHRDNLIVSEGEHPIACVDWELATYGDPLHELATHLVRMRYPDDQWDSVVRAWAEAMERHRPSAVNGLTKDLNHYVGFERAQSVFPDVMRAARSLEDGLDDETLARATAGVFAALESAAAPLGLARVPGVAEIERVLVRWRDSRHRRPVGFRPVPPLEWEPDSRVPEHPDFPGSAVERALVAEGAAAAGRVFRGTAHLNSVVRVEGIDFPVMVRRRLVSFCRREPSHLSEHAVLRAIERSDAGVAAPRVLALGMSQAKEPFAIHTYVGPIHSDRPPSHPVTGLLPHEADGLVNQLDALTRVECSELDQITDGSDFYTWLSRELVSLVRGMPVESQQLAKSLGLPDADRLSDILARHQVRDRRRVLLHGDLNPWNLVRHTQHDDRALTIIDWEMAMVGDPLYDLVRHVHLTPTRPEIRERMLRRWESTLPRECTRDWRRDWSVYRWVESIRSAYVDLDRIVTGAGLDAPNVRRAVDSYAMTLAVATASLGLRVRHSAHSGLAPWMEREAGPGSASTAACAV
ncbi:aminoglycoside phosphotransferase family protein [Streptomyces sp. NPDC098781]|uniref:aminoglycoside phosphotransferase family protein n=1 Tax=Streptomyces sp. NPDC098781 TaxID=3366097 RepID=UPI003807EF81